MDGKIMWALACFVACRTLRLAVGMHVDRGSPTTAMRVSGTEAVAFDRERRFRSLSHESFVIEYLIAQTPERRGISCYVMVLHGAIR